MDLIIILDIITAWILAFFSSVKPWVIWYITLESYRAYKWKVFTFKGYLVRALITLGFLYFSRGLIKELGLGEEQFMFLAGAFSIIIIDILEEKVPALLRTKADNFINWKNKW